MLKNIPMNLQYFAEEATNEETTAQQSTEESQTTETDAAGNKIPYERFKQKVDEANEYKRRLEEFENAQKEKQTKELEEQNEFKTLYEAAQQQIDALKQETLVAKKEARLASEGYTKEQIEKYGKYVEGVTDEEIAESIATLKADIAPKQSGVDPSLGGHTRQETPQKDPQDDAKSLYQKLKASGRLRK